jgi:hypothetical protein
MKHIKAELPANYELVISSDLHLGCPNVNEDTIQEMIEYVGTTKHAYMANIGDNIEGICAWDKRFSHNDNPYKTPIEQANRIIELFKPIRKKILAWGYGNHENTVLGFGDMGRLMADGIGCPYGSGLYTLEAISKNHKGLMHKMFFTHGMGSFSSKAKDYAQRQANMMSALKLKLQTCGLDDVILMAMGHTHKSLIVNPTGPMEKHFNTYDGHVKKFHIIDYDQTSSYIPADFKWYISNPSFMKLYSSPDNDYMSYGEMAGYSPSDIGFTKVRIVNSKVTSAELVEL